MVITDPIKQKKKIKVSTIIKIIKPPLILSIHMHCSRNELVLKMLPQPVSGKKTHPGKNTAGVITHLRPEARSH